MWLWLHLGVGRHSIKPYPGFYCCLKTDIFWIAIFFSREWHCHIFQDKQFSKGASSFLTNVIWSLLYPNLLPSWVILCYIHFLWFFYNMYGFRGDHAVFWTRCVVMSLLQTSLTLPCFWFSPDCTQFHGICTVGMVRLYIFAMESSSHRCPLRIH